MERAPVTTQVRPMLPVVRRNFRLVQNHVEHESPLHAGHMSENHHTALDAACKGAERKGAASHAL